MDSHDLAPTVKKRKLQSDVAVVTESEPVTGDLFTASNARPSIFLLGDGYEVFLSFRGPDTRTGFTDYLYESLKGAGVNVFRDNEGLPLGEAIVPELVRGIMNSKISIPILSTGYASSKWCLEEAALMVECRKKGNQLILPIFYDVTPHDVRHFETGSYAEAYSQHLKDYGPEKVSRWRQALEEIGALKGLELKNVADGHEGRLINLVVAKVLSELKKARLLVTDKLVEMDDCVEEVKGLLDVEARDVRIVGLWGMGGIGKTTLAKVIYNQLAGDFERCSFLPDIREASKQHSGLKELQAQLFADLSRSRQERPNIGSIDEGVNKIRNMFRSMRVLILLDNIDKIDQLKALAPDVDCFGPGSRIIVTTRNRDALRVPHVGMTYEVRGMDGEKALQLFHKHAFWKDHPTPELRELSRDIVKTTGGLPLAIEVISSYLSGKSISVWRATLEKSRRIPHVEVQNKLRISYEALQHEEQQVFLDIACFFIGENKTNATLMWEDCKFYPDVAIEVLELMSLIKIQDVDKLWMHDQLRDLGREIVRQENYNVPGRRSRLWSTEDAVGVLEGFKSTEFVEAISVDYGVVATRYAFEGQSFRNMSKLRYLRLKGADLAGNFQNHLLELRWLSWQISSFSCNMTNLHLPNLVILDIIDSGVSDEWNFWRSTQIYGKLKVLNLSWCNKLTKTPDFSMFPNLESLTLDKCTSLSEVHPSITDLKFLSLISLRGCSRIRDLPHQQGSGMEKLEILRLDQCQLLTRVPEYIDCMTSLIVLEIDGSGVSQLPESIGSLLKLQYLSANECRSLTGLPDSIQQLESLTYLNLSHTQIAILPDSVGNLSNLEELLIGDTCISHFPTALKNLQKLKVLNANGCRNLMGQIPMELGELSDLQELSLRDTKICSIPEAISRASHLCSFNLGGCKLLDSLPELPVCLVCLQVTCKSEVPIPNLCDLTNLKALEFYECLEFTEVPRDIAKLSRLETLVFLGVSIRSLPNELGDLPRLKVLMLRFCRELEYLPTLPSSLHELTLRRCDALMRLPNLSNLGNLLKLHVISCGKLLQIQVPGDHASLMLCGLERLESPVSLDISRCKAIEGQRNISKLKSLRIVRVLGCQGLIEIGLGELEALVEIYISECRAVKKLGNLSKSKQLRDLSIEGCKDLQEVEGVQKLDALVKLSISGSIEKLPNMSNLKMLRELKISECGKLRELEGLGGLEKLKSLDIRTCTSIEKLQGLHKLKSLEQLCVEDCENLQELDGLDKLEELHKLHIKGCKSIKMLPDLSKLKKLMKLKVSDCVELTRIPGLENLELLQDKEISGCLLLLQEATGGSSHIFYTWL